MKLFIQFNSKLKNNNQIKMYSSIYAMKIKKKTGNTSSKYNLSRIT